MSTSKIEWTDETWNSIVGCSHISPACDHCYAERMARRQVAMRNHPASILKDGRWSGQVAERVTKPPSFTPKRVFVGSMTDLFHPMVRLAWLDRIWGLMEERKLVTFQILTKRPDRMLEYVENRAARGLTFDLPNLWVGATVENQDQDWRIHFLLQTPAAVRFVSIEPMLGDVDLDLSFDGPASLRAIRRADPSSNREGKALLDWVICGGETGPGARLMHTAWATSLRDQCAAAGVPFFFKKWGNASLNDGSGLAPEMPRQFPEERP